MDKSLTLLAAVAIVPTHRSSTGGTTLGPTPLSP
jgi:hypothetical protein